jgi:hypothetical protein
MDDVLEWDAEPYDDDPGSDDEREVFGRVAGQVEKKMPVVFQRYRARRS